MSEKSDQKVNLSLFLIKSHSVKYGGSGILAPPILSRDTGLR